MLLHQQLPLLLKLLMSLLLQRSFAFVGRCENGQIIIKSSSSGGIQESAAASSASSSSSSSASVAATSDKDSANVITSPGWPKHYPENIRCQYKFVAKSNQKVQLTFTDFNVEGLERNVFTCAKDFIDIYINVSNSNASLAESSLFGRYCGHSLESVPQTLVSLGSVLVLDFFSDSNTQRVYNGAGGQVALGFRATFKFIDFNDYRPGAAIGEGSGGCSFLITAKSGLVQSPTFPGMYPDMMRCVYLFRGGERERVLLQFKEFDIYEIPNVLLGGANDPVNSCPIDKASFYDGNSHERPIGRAFCGSRPGLSLMSSSSDMRFEFSSGSARIPRAGADPQSAGVYAREFQRRGYWLTFNISSRFFPVPPQLSHLHITGTECDFLIKSNGTSSGSFQFPAVSSGKRCKLFFQGRHNRQGTEVVQLQFHRFVAKRHGNSGKCSSSEASLKLYQQGQSPEAMPDHQLCQQKAGDDFEMQNFTSVGPLSFVELNTKHLAQGILAAPFTVNYRFITDFGIPGQPTEEGSCSYVYSSEQFIAGGVTNSPLFDLSTGAHYPHNATCYYRFQSAASRSSGQRIRIRFAHFYVEDYFIEALSNDKRHHSVGPYVPCVGDRVEIFEAPRNSRRAAGDWLKILTYCGTAIPGPYVTQAAGRDLIVAFTSTWNKWEHADYGKRTATGFQIQFDFPTVASAFSAKPDECGGKISSDSHGGVIKLPASEGQTYKTDLICEWHIYPSRRGNDIFVEFPEFHLEGSTKSCSMAVLRLYRGNNAVPLSELCGADNSIPAFYAAGAPFLRIRFLTAAHSRGGKGFTISWTEDLLHSNNAAAAATAAAAAAGTAAATAQKSSRNICTGFKCKITQHCIDHSLECNGLPNCGSLQMNATTVFDSAYGRWKNYSEFVMDNSDEQVNCPSNASYQLLHVGIGVLTTVLLVIMIVGCVLYREHRRSGKKHRDSMQDLSASRQLMPSAAGVQQQQQQQRQHQHQQLVTASPEAFATIKNGGHLGSSAGAYSHSHSTSTLTRERMQKISIV